MNVATQPAAPGPVETVGVALRSWTPRQWVAAGLFTVAFALLIGIPTVLIPNPVFGREIPVVAWNYPAWIATSVLAGMLAATYVRPRRLAGAPGAVDGGALAGDAPDEVDRPSRLGMVGGVLTWFAVGCPVCNKVALLALGYSGALTWFAPVQPYLAGVALLLTAGALVVRLRGQVACPVPAVPAVPRG
ncbi:hypothetical protein [Cellulomonas carbonis]|uniref:Uncharacterized protein n=1 Tax=Cellulomonas carbonis T26 TaxID=947969 RepID=A0A0A0BVN7_9CELL|nr:hypothetical protein [Cellulomonas carbonis]KGM12045.1 hypothetical protein N868_02625 [Cellulomonas carbonis T26]GGC08007.1 hypothetical protein GCM10010972_21600 [Cellulomonas carbonis]